GGRINHGLPDFAARNRLVKCDRFRLGKAVLHWMLSCERQFKTALASCRRSNDRQYLVDLPDNCPVAIAANNVWIACPRQLIICGRGYAPCANLFSSLGRLLSQAHCPVDPFFCHAFDGSL